MTRTAIPYCLIFGAMLLVALSPEPAFASSGGALFSSGTNVLNALVTLLSSTWVRLVAIIYVIFVGWRVFAGRIDMGLIVAAIAGLVLTFGAPSIVAEIGDLASR